MNRTRYSISAMCRFFGVSRSGYYDYLHRSERPAFDAALAELIRECQRQADKTYGYRRVHLWLKERNIYKNPKKAAEKYKNWKTRIQRPKPSYLGFPARNNNTPNLIIRGDFYSSITAIPISDGVKIVSYGVSFGADIESKYGSQIFKVSTKAREHYIMYRLIPHIDKFTKQCGI